MKKIVIVTNIPNPYRIPLFNELHQQLQKKNIYLKVIFGAENYARRKFKLNPDEFKFDFEFLSSFKFHFGNREKTFFTYKGLIGLVNREKPDKIIIGGFSIGTVKLWLRSFFWKTDYIIWSGSIERKERNDSFVRLLIQKILLKKASAFVAYGSKAKEYLISLGANPEKVFIAINTVDTDFFSSRTKFLRVNNSKPDNKKHLTYIGYLSKRKNVIRVLEIIKQLARERTDFVFDLVGEGDNKTELENFVKAHGLESVVRFHGFVQRENLPEYLSVSQVFLFQTDFDIWGLVLNEAMAAGLPCISSPNAGASFDLVKENQNGFIIDFKDGKKVIEKINLLLDNPGVALRMGKSAEEFMRQNTSLEISALGFVNSLLLDEKLT